MKELSVLIEINGMNVRVGSITGNDSSDACFTYDEDYIQKPDLRPISISLPFEKKAFDSKSTRNFFEGLLPEGFTRRCVAEYMQKDAQDYLSILTNLGKECLGAIKILDENPAEIKAEYQRLTDSEVRNLAKEGAAESAQLVAKSHLSLTGASGKVGLYYNERERQWYLPVGDAPSTHIVKQSHVRLKRIVANEQLCLMTAANLGIDIPESFIINLGNAEDENVLFATRRYDRITESSVKKLSGMTVPYRLHQEDFAQALGISSYSKYEKNNENYLKKLFDTIRNYSSDPIADQLKLWDICIFNYLIGNTDNHIKNLSLLYGKDMKSIRLAPAYDIVSTMIYESSTENMALSIGGTYSLNQINRDSFEKEAVNLGLGTGMAMKRFDKIANAFEKALKKAESELIEQGFEASENISKRILQKGGIKTLL